MSSPPAAWSGLLCASLQRGTCALLPSPGGPSWPLHPWGEDAPQGSSSRALGVGGGGPELACALCPSEPHVPLRGAVAGSHDHWQDPGAPTGQGPGTAVLTGNSRPARGQAASGAPGRNPESRVPSRSLGLSPWPSCVTFPQAGSQPDAWTTAVFLERHCRAASGLGRYHGPAWSVRPGEPSPQYAWPWGCLQPL